MNISEMSGVIPVMVRHAVWLDWASREAMEGTVGPGSHSLTTLSKALGSTQPGHSLQQGAQLIILLSLMS